MDSHAVTEPALDRSSGARAEDIASHPVAPAAHSRRRACLALVVTALASATLGAAVTAGVSAREGSLVAPATAPSAPAVPASAAGATSDRSSSAQTSAAGPGGGLATGPGGASAVLDQRGASAVPDPGSGLIGPWQQMGHSRSAQQADRQAATDPRGVFLVGDSLATRVRPALTKALGKRPVAWDHWNGRPTHANVDVFEALEQAHHLPQTLLVLSGSNDVFDPLRFATQVDRLLEIAGTKRQIVWAVPSVRRAKFADADTHNSRIIEAALRRAASTNPNLRLVDWAGHVAALPPARAAQFMPDGVHPSPAGSVELSKLIVADLG
ncbi:MAG: hypothetical protein Q4P32_05560 [Micrococcales bacterium]|nr:hypothetical protein [Micrococcales bacterium]